MPIKKDKIVLDIEHEPLKELRKILFSHGVSVQGFLSFIAELVSMRDARIDFLLEEAPKTSQQRKNKTKSDAEGLYALIEQEIKKQQSGV